MLSSSSLKVPIDFNIVNDTEETPLLYAISLNYYEGVQKLVENNVDVNKICKIVLIIN